MPPASDEDTGDVKPLHNAPLAIFKLKMAVEHLQRSHYQQVVHTLVPINYRVWHKRQEIRQGVVKREMQQILRLWATFWSHLHITYCTGLHPCDKIGKIVKYLYLNQLIYEN